MQWLRDELQLIHAAPESEWYAGQVPSTEGVYLVPAFTGLAAPTWDPHARAAIVGISNSTNRLHIIRAAVESMVYQTRDVLEAARAGSHFTFDELRIDGGAVKNNLLCQLLADILGIPVVSAEEHRGHRLWRHAAGRPVDRCLPHNRRVGGHLGGRPHLRAPDEP